MNRIDWSKRVRSCVAGIAPALILLGIECAYAGPCGTTAAIRADDEESTSAERNMESAPYSVRLRITGFLARQHAREGDMERALREYHSMLGVDDPSWPDNEDGDSMRISRDMEVARMMVESGLFDHAVRVLDVALILAEVNDDPQRDAIERQISAITELARLKGVSLPKQTPIESHATARRLADIDRGESKEDDEDVTVSAPPRSLPPVHKSTTVYSSSATPESSLPELPPANLKKATPAAEPARVVQPTTEPESQSVIERLVPSRWGQAESTRSTMPANPQAMAAQPRVSPDVSPQYCPECSTHAGWHTKPHGPTATGVGSSARMKGDWVVDKSNSNSESSVQAAASEQSAAADRTITYGDVQPIKRGVLNKLAARRAARNSDSGPIITTPPVVEEHRTPGSSTFAPTAPMTMPSPGVSGSSTDLRRSPRTIPADSSKTESGLNLAAAQAQRVATPTTSAPAAQSKAASSDSRTIPADSEEALESVNESTRHATAPRFVETQVGVAGQVANPGIFTFEGNSTTLAALLRRSGADSNTSKRTRVLRRVELHDSADEIGPQQDFYLQRLDVAPNDGRMLATPVYRHEVVIVDGDGPQPVYIAVMPHFILQIPTAPDRPATAQQIVDQLRVHWPNIRNQEIGVLRFEHWGRAAKVARAQDDSDSLDLPLRGGDVVFVDGVGLSHDQVLAAAEAIARIVGAKVRTH